MPTLVRQHRNRNNRLSPYRVFQIPELLCQIFAFLDNTTLRKTIILVCRQWYWMNKDRIVREVLFDSGLTLDDLKRRMDEIKKRPLLHLTLQGYVEIGMGVSGFLPYMATLTRLTINQVCDSNFTMSELFETCTQLEHLYIQSLWTVHLTGPWIPDNSTIDDSPPPQLLPLKSLKLIHVQFPQSCLEILLTSTPHLKELKLVLRGYIADDENDLTHLCQHLQSLPELKLESFHFSIGSDTHPQTYDDYARMMALCPKSTGWTIRGPHLSLDTSRLITESSSNRITALENASWEDSSLKAMSCLNIASGFCQLARLKHLESLCIDEVDLDGLLFESHDIDWMVSSASSSPLSLPLLSSSVSGLSGSGGSGDLSSSVTSRQLSPWSQRRWSKQKRRRAISLCAEYYCDEKSKFTENVKLINSMSDSEILEKYGADRAEPRGGGCEVDCARDAQ
ncbi:hypothetical protein EC991_009683 [Linnemannia zychae]|nr:hypothetical protein EC991_009683 [Linnemannia zychae]